MKLVAGHNTYRFILDSIRQFFQFFKFYFKKLQISLNFVICFIFWATNDVLAKTFCSSMVNSYLNKLLRLLLRHEEIVRS